MNLTLETIFMIKLISLNILAKCFFAARCWLLYQCLRCNVSDVIYHKPKLLADVPDSYVASSLEEMQIVQALYSPCQNGGLLQ